MAEQGDDTLEPCSSARVYMFECLMTKYPNAESVIPLSRQQQTTLQSACSGTAANFCKRPFYLRLFLTVTITCVLTTQAFFTVPY